MNFRKYFYRYTKTQPVITLTEQMWYYSMGMNETATIIDSKNKYDRMINHVFCFHGMHEMQKYVDYIRQSSKIR